LRVLFVILAILLVLLLLLCIPVVVRFSATDGERAVSLRWLFVRRAILPAVEKPDKPEKPKKPKPSGQKKRDPAAVLRETPFPDLIREGAALLERCAPPVRRFFRRVTVAKFSLQLLVAGKTAADTAIRYGRWQSVIPLTVAVADRTVRLRPERIDIIPGFTAEKERFALSGEARVAPLAALIVALNLLCAALPVYRRLSRREKQAA